MNRPARAQMATTTELRAALDHSLSEYFAAPRRVTHLERRASGYRTSFALEELYVCLDDGSTLHLIFKDLSRGALGESARRVKPTFLHDPLREIEAYRSILAANRLGTAACYGTVTDTQCGRYWLFLEKVPGIELYQVGEFAIWQWVARWLAGLHTRFSGLVGSLRGTAHLLTYDQDFYRLWLRRAQAFSCKANCSQLRNAQSRIEWLADRYDRVVEHLVSLPATFIHGEFYASNVLVQHKEGGVRVCPIDWEMAAVGPGLIDLAALTAGKWTDEEKTALALAYHAALPTDSGLPSTPGAFLLTLECCRLALAVQWLGWSPEWVPPPEHAQDWLGEALRSAERLGL